MKSLKKVSLLALAMMSITACNNANQESEPLNLETQEAKEAYSLGAVLGTYMSSQLKEQESAGLNLDDALIIEGFKQGLAGKKQLSDEEMREIMKELDKKVSDLRRVKDQEIAVENQKKGEAFLEQNKAKEGVKVTNSGLQYEVLQAGTGAKPTVDDTVEVHYRGTLIDGTEFDSSYKHGEPVKLPLARVIPGWSEGVQLMPIGSKYKFVIPANLGYGEHGAGNIPANSTLVFEVELLSIEKSEAPSTTQVSDKK